MRILNSIVLVAALLGTLAQAEEKRELLARHETVAVFTGAPFKKCLGLTALCPDKCEGSGEVATFEIRGYLVYEKRGQYGDPQQGQFTVRISDHNKKPLGNPARRAVLDDLKPGDFVLLSWQHDYVTSDGSSFPARPVTNLKKIPAAEAAELLKKASPAPAAPKEPVQPRGAAPAARAVAF
jgi:hypothetical protein